MADRQWEFGPSEADKSRLSGTQSRAKREYDAAKSASRKARKDLKTVMRKSRNPADWREASGKVVSAEAAEKVAKEAFGAADRAYRAAIAFKGGRK